MAQKPTVLITGASSGFGLATAKTFAQAGYTVFASMRGTTAKNASVVEDIQAWSKQGLDLRAIELDILDDDSVNNAVSKIIDATGRIDILINNAGMLVFGITEAFTPAQIQQVFDTNVVGILRVNRAVFPHMRRQQSGLVLYVGSVTSRIISPFQGPYVASKAAEDAIAQTMHYENSRYGIDSVIIMPGAFTSGTNHFAHAVPPADQARVQAYDLIADIPQQLINRLDSLMAANASMNPQQVADKMLEVAQLPAGQRPFRIVVDPQNHGAEPINEVALAKQAEFMTRLGIQDLMLVAIPTPSAY